MGLFAGNRRVGSAVRSLFMTLLLCGLLTAGAYTDAAAQDWPFVLRPGINMGTGTADYNISLFAPVYQDSSTMFFFTPNFRHNTGADQNEVNLGLGLRSLVSGEAYLGANVFYDEVRSRNSHNFHQIGLGIEGRSTWIDATLNGHIAISDTQEEVHDNDSVRLSGLTILQADGKEEQLPGLEGEVGILIPVVSDYVETRAYIGGYYWMSDLLGDIEGVKVRLELTPVKFVTMNVSYDYDNEFDSTWRGEVYLNVPFDLSSNPFSRIGEYLTYGKAARSVSDRMTDRVERDRYIIVVEGNDSYRPVAVLTPN